MTNYYCPLVKVWMICEECVFISRYDTMIVCVSLSIRRRPFFVFMCIFVCFVCDIGNNVFFFISVVAFILYLSFMVSFFWLNVMCFDIWWTFRWAITFLSYYVFCSKYLMFLLLFEWNKYFFTYVFRLVKEISIWKIILVYLLDEWY